MTRTEGTKTKPATQQTGIPLTGHLCCNFPTAHFYTTLRASSLASRYAAIRQDRESDSQADDPARFMLMMSFVVIRTICSDSAPYLFSVLCFCSSLTLIVAEYEGRVRHVCDEAMQTLSMSHRRVKCFAQVKAAVERPSWWRTWPYGSLHLGART
jgi:hypothetical protein